MASDCNDALLAFAGLACRPHCRKCRSSDRPARETRSPFLGISLRQRMHILEHHFCIPMRRFHTHRSCTTRIASRSTPLPCSLQKIVDLRGYSSYDYRDTALRRLCTFRERLRHRPANSASYRGIENHHTHRSGLGRHPSTCMLHPVRNWRPRDTPHTPPPPRLQPPCDHLPPLSCCWSRQALRTQAQPVRPHWHPRRT